MQLFETKLMHLKYYKTYSIVKTAFFGFIAHFLRLYSGRYARSRCAA